MKIIISHDVDHLYASDHFFKDLIIPKLLIRSLIHVVQGKISLRTFCYRFLMVFNNRMHRLDEIMEFDNQNKVPSTFFFGMNNALGMSYSISKAFPQIEKVKKKGFEIGVHGVEYERIAGIKAEHDAFSQVAKIQEFGIRNHYVRFNENTFNMLAETGYMFDSTWFDKTKLNIKEPFKVGEMWELPLHIMDEYICKPGMLKQGILDTISAVKFAEENNMPYCTILFHDYHFDDKRYPDLKEWYVKTIKYLKENEYQFISFKEAVVELEERKNAESNTLCE